MRAIGFIGCGKMAGALAKGIAASGICDAEHLSLCDAYPQVARVLAEKSGGTVRESNAECIRASDVVFLCVKPGDAAVALAECQSDLKGKLVLSILAGVTTDALGELCGPGARVIRAMPNTAATVNASATVFCAGPGAEASDLEFARTIFEAVGTATEVPEKFLDAATGVSGSGPAYFFALIEAIAEGGVHAGLPRPLALALAAQTALGAGRLASESGEHPAILREAVTSPGGTTAAALAVLENAGFRGAVIGAVGAAAARAAELSQ